MDKRSAVRRSGKCFATTPLMRKSLIYRAFLRHGWSEVGESDNWDIFWADVYSVGLDSGFDLSRLKTHQRLNHFPRHTELTRKSAEGKAEGEEERSKSHKMPTRKVDGLFPIRDALVKNLKRARKSLEREFKDASAYDFFPQTFVLPQEYGMFADEFRNDPGCSWIMKPSGRSQGEGIFLINRLKQVFSWRKGQQDNPKAEPYIISRYIDKPLLIGGRKFDLRLYVMVTAFAPLQIYIYRAGFCRFSCGRYDANNLEDLNLHLTNVAIQRKQDGYDHSTGMKWPLASLRKYLQGSHGAQTADSTFRRVQDVVIHSLLAVQHVVTADRHCFELFGYDILLDENLKPWLIEVNASPSLSADTLADLQLKNRMLDDTLLLLEDVGGTPACVGGFDLIWASGEAVVQHATLASLLGCCIPDQ